MSDRRSFELLEGGRAVATVHTVFTDAEDGNFASDSEPAGLRLRRRAVADLQWAWVKQIHGATVLEPHARAADPAEQAVGEADGLLSDRAGTLLSVQVADCAPVLLFAPTADGAVVAAVHAGWRGLMAGVLDNAVGDHPSFGVPTSMGTRPLHLRPPLRVRTERPGGDRGAVRSTGASRSETGTPALDLRAAVRSAMLSGCGEQLGDEPVCTAESPGTGPTGPRRLRAAGRSDLVGNEVGRRPHDRGDGAPKRVAGADLRDHRQVGAKVIAVTKGHPPEVVLWPRWGRGSVDLGENYAQELVAKADFVAQHAPEAEPRWHFVGRLQSNKVRMLAPMSLCGRPWTGVGGARNWLVASPVPPCCARWTWPEYPVGVDVAVTRSAPWCRRRRTPDWTFAV
ncbi:MAG: laccase domain-containing protein [Microthrixaceae bacterium]